HPNRLVFTDFLFLPTIAGVTISQQARALLPIAIYRQQVTNEFFPRVSGTLPQVTPLLERLAYDVEKPTQQSPKVVYVDDLLVAGGVEYASSDSGFQHPHSFLYLRDQQPVSRGAAYQYFVVRLNRQRDAP